jgi:hypothetical protein
MDHKHTYETQSHHGVSPELMEIGVHAAEIRKCTVCGQEMPFLQIRKNQWVPLFFERQLDSQDILLA